MGMVLVFQLALAAQEPLGQATLDGVVLNDVTGQPVAGAEVFVDLPDDPRTEETDDNGAFLMAGLPAGRFLVGVAATGFEKASRQETLVAGSTLHMTQH